MTFDPVSYSEIKKLGKPIVKSSVPPSSTDVIWYDETDGYYKIYSPKFNRWVLLVNFGNDNFDNNGGWYWTNYIEIPIQTPPDEHIQYLIEINGTTVSVYSNDLTKTLVSSTINNFWNNVQTNGNDIRVFDETFGQNFFWIEEFDYSNQVAKIWVKINAGQELLGITFGNKYAGHSYFNNGDYTFEFFDDFSTGDTSKWDSVDTTAGTPNFVPDDMGGYYIDMNGAYLIKNLKLDKTFIEDVLFMKVRDTPDGETYYNFIRVKDSTTNTIYGLGVVYNSDGTDEANISKYDGTWTVLSSYSYQSDNNWHRFCFCVNGSTMRMVKDGVLIGESTDDGILNINIDCIELGRYNAADNVLIRNYLPSDLTFGTPTLKSF